MSDRIVMLRGPERVRRRPAVIFGDNNIRGAQQAVRTILEIFATEAQLGHCKHLTVVHNGAELTICGDDRGIYLGQDKNDDTIWKNIFCTPYGYPAYRPEEDGYSLGLQDTSHHVLYGDPVEPNATFFPEDNGYWGLYCTQCATKNMVVISVRDGVKSTLRFEGGYNVGGIKHENSDDSRGTYFHFELDSQVFTEVVIPSAFFFEALERLAMLSPGLACSYIDAKEGDCKEFLYPNGVADYVQRKAESEITPVYSKKIEAKGKERYNCAEYEACVEVVLAPTPGRGNTLCMHNFRELTYGGAHYQQMQKRLCSAFNEYFLSYIIGEEPKSAVERANARDKNRLIFDELSKHLTVVLATWCAPYCSAWVNATRLAINNRMITDMTYDCLDTEFRNYVYENREILRPIVNAILDERKAKAIT